MSVLQKSTKENPENRPKLKCTSVERATAVSYLLGERSLQKRYVQDRREIASFLLGGVRIQLMPITVQYSTLLLPSALCCW